MIHAHGLTKDYGTRRAIENLNFHVDQGEILGFLGPNGAGKTTTMRILTGSMPPSEGMASVAGFDVVSDALQVRRRVGFLPESTPLYPDMTISEYLRFMADLRHLNAPDIRISSVLAQFGLENRAKNRIGILSNETRQRVGLAQAILHEPEVVILDEPTQKLNSAQKINIRHLIRDIGRERTVVLATHSLSEVQHICDRVLIINMGKIVGEDTPERLQAHMTGAKRILLHVRGDGDGLAALIRGVPGVTQVSVLEEGRAEFTTAPGQDIRPQVARAIIESNFELLELRSLAESVEEVFLKLARDELSEPNAIDRDVLSIGASQLDDIGEGVEG